MKLPYWCVREEKLNVFWRKQRGIKKTRFLCARNFKRATRIIFVLELNYFWKGAPHFFKELYTIWYCMNCFCQLFIFQLSSPVTSFNMLGSWVTKGYTKKHQDKTWLLRYYFSFPSFPHSLCCYFAFLLFSTIILASTITINGNKKKIKTR